MEEFSPDFVYIKGNDNTVADALSRLAKKGNTIDNALEKSETESEKQENTPGYSESYYHPQMYFALSRFTQKNHMSKMTLKKMMSHFHWIWNSSSKSKKRTRTCN